MENINSGTSHTPSECLEAVDKFKKHRKELKQAEKIRDFLITFQRKVSAVLRSNELNPDHNFHEHDLFDNEELKVRLRDFEFLSEITLEKMAEDSGLEGTRVQMNYNYLLNLNPTQFFQLIFRTLSELKE